MNLKQVANSQQTFSFQLPTPAPKAASNNTLTHLHLPPAQSLRSPQYMEQQKRLVNREQQREQEQQRVRQQQEEHLRQYEQQLWQQQQEQAQQQREREQQEQQAMKAAGNGTGRAQHSSVLRPGSPAQFGPGQHRTP